MKQTLDHQRARKKKARFIENHELAVSATVYCERVAVMTASYVSMVIVKVIPQFMVTWTRSGY
jgi:hypothetical protein